MYMKGTEAIIKSLENEGVDVIFGIPGGQSIPFYDELYDADIRHILTRHEQGAAHAAEGYARASGKVGVCSSTSGPGGTNLVTGIANAYMDSSPIIALTGQVATSFIGKDAFQETDMVGISMPITKHNFQLRSVKEIPVTFKMAFKIASTGRPGPVLIDMPKDIQEKEDNVSFPKDVNIPGYKPTFKGNPRQIQKAINMILNAERPIILAGGGVIISGAGNELKELAELIMAPVTSTLMGKGGFPENHPLSVGVLGMHGRKVANYAINEADVIIAVGTRFSDRSTGMVGCYAPEAKIIHIEIDPAEISKNVYAHLPVVGDARNILAGIIKGLKVKASKGNGGEWLKKIHKYRKEFQPRMDYDDIPLRPERIVKEIMDFMGMDDIVTTEVGQAQMWAFHYFGRSRPRTFISSGGLGTMGFGFPAAMGAKVARPEANVIDIAGDGSFQMNIQELATVVENDIPVVVAVFNNGFLGMVRQWQELFFNKRYSATSFKRNPDFVKVAEGYGAMGIQVERPEDITPALKTAFKSGEPAVIDFIVNPEANIFPMVPPGKCLKDIIEGD